MTPREALRIPRAPRIHALWRSLANALRTSRTFPRSLPHVRKDRLVNLQTARLFSASSGAVGSASCGGGDKLLEVLNKDANHWIRKSIATSSSLREVARRRWRWRAKCVTFTRFASTADGTTAPGGSGSMEISLNGPFRAHRTPASDPHRSDGRAIGHSIQQRTMRRTPGLL